MYFIAISLQRKDLLEREEEYSIIKDLEKLLNLGERNGELIFPYYRQFIAYKVGIPMNENPNVYPLNEIENEIFFSNSTTFYNYRDTVLSTLNIIFFLLDNNIKSDKRNSKVTKLQLIYLIESNYNFKQLIDLIDI